jgi:hypothetical protein
VSPELSHDAAQELLGVYALDAVPWDEREALEAHLAECPRCRAEVAMHRETAAMLAGPGSQAPDGVWDRISGALQDGEDVPELERVRSRRAGQPRRWVATAAAAAAVAAVVSLGLEVTEQRRELERVTAGMEEGGLLRAANAALLNPEATRIDLTSEDGSVGVQAVLLPDGRGYLVQDSLRPLPEDRTYQLWALGDQVISAGVLGHDPGVAAFNVSPEITGLAITDEVAGGVVAPKESPVVTGQVPT